MAKNGKMGKIEKMFTLSCLGDYGDSSPKHGMFAKVDRISVQMMTEQKHEGLVLRSSLQSKNEGKGEE